MLAKKYLLFSGDLYKDDLLNIILIDKESNIILVYKLGAWCEDVTERFKKWYYSKSKSNTVGADYYKTLICEHHYPSCIYEDEIFINTDDKKEVVDKIKELRLLQAEKILNRAKCNIDKQDNLLYL